MNYHRFFMVQIFFLASLSGTSLSFHHHQSPQEREELFPTVETLSSVNPHSLNERKNTFTSQSFQKAAANSTSFTNCLIAHFTESTLNYLEIQKKTTQTSILKQGTQKLRHLSRDAVKTLKFFGTPISSLLCNKYTKRRISYFQNQNATGSNKHTKNSVFKSTSIASFLNH